MGGCDQSVVHAHFFSSGFHSVLIKSGFIGPGLHPSAATRTMGTKSCPRFNEVMLELACEEKRLRQTPLSDVHISYLPLPRSLPFLNY